jgi:PKHD-type hydroxylase
MSRAHDHLPNQKAHGFRAQAILEGPSRSHSIHLSGRMRYPASTVHRVETVTRGERWASIFWVQSMVADQSRRTLLHDLDTAIVAARAELGDIHPASVSLTGTYHNLIRMWARV